MAVVTVQDIMYVLYVLELVGLRAHLLIILEVANNNTLYLTNSWSIRGGTQDTLMCNRPSCAY